MLGPLTNRRWHVLFLTLLTLAMVLPGLSTLPVIDRDEARFAQASVQMAESDDLLNIRFQDEARNKKPAAAYWAQTAMIKTFSRDGERRIWAQRIPSVLAALVTILALYWGGARMVGREAAIIAAALLATTTIFVFEGHIAKTDALLCASTTLIFACLGRLRHMPGPREVWVFWITLGLSILIKGPIGPLLVVFTLSSLWIWEKNFSWTRPLLNWGAICVFVLIWLPWAIAMYVVTDGAFYTESLGQDLGGKIVSGQEGHGAVPGFQSLTIWAALWPASLFLLPGIAYAIKSVRSGGDETIMQAMRLIFCWAIPFWLLIEIMPTKLPHYGLPVFPALCLMIGAAIIAMSKTAGYAKTRIIGAVIFWVATAFLLGALAFVQINYGDPNRAFGTYLICAVSGLFALIAGQCLWRSQVRRALGTGIASSLVYLIGAYGYALPNMPNFQTPERMSVALELFAPGTESHMIHSPYYSEPSLVYHVGKDIDLRRRDIDLSNGSLVILNLENDKAEDERQKLLQAALRRGACLKSSDTVSGFNYSRGEEPLNLIILREEPCSVSLQTKPISKSVNKHAPK